MFQKDLELIVHNNIMQGEPELTLLSTVYLIKHPEEMIQNPGIQRTPSYFRASHSFFMCSPQLIAPLCVIFINQAFMYPDPFLSLGCSFNINWIFKRH